MTTERGSWEDFGRAAEQLARRVARDARRFAARLEDDVGAFAHDVRRQWRCGEWHTRGAGAHWARSPEDVQRVFQDVRSVLAGVLDGVDELIASVFQSAKGDEGWARVVLNREATCVACAKPIGAGAEAFLRRGAATKEFRCLECGAPPD